MGSADPGSPILPNPGAEEGTGSGGGDGAAWTKHVIVPAFGQGGEFFWIDNYDPILDHFRIVDLDVAQNQDQGHDL